MSKRPVLRKRKHVRTGRSRSEAAKLGHQRKREAFAKRSKAAKLGWLRRRLKLVRQVVEQEPEYVAHWDPHYAPGRNGQRRLYKQYEGHGDFEYLMSIMNETYPKLRIWSFQWLLIFEDEDGEEVARHWASNFYLTKRDNAIESSIAKMEQDLEQNRYQFAAYVQILALLAAPGAKPLDSNLGH